jgi:ABC-type multidrug transport system fused ATPase/permease subunit
MDLGVQVNSLRKFFQSTTRKLAWRLVKERKRIVFILLVCACVDSLLDLLYPFAMQQLIDEAGAKQNYGIMTIIWILIFMFYGTISKFFIVIEKQWREELTTDVDMSLKGFLIWGKLQDVSFLKIFAQKDLEEKAKTIPDEVSDELEERNERELAAILVGLTEDVSSFVSTFFPGLLTSLLSFIALWSMWKINPLITCMCIAGLGTMGLIGFVLKKYTRLNRQLFQYRTRLAAQTVEFVQQLPLFQLFGAGKREKEVFERTLMEYKALRIETMWTAFKGITLVSSVSNAVMSGMVLLIGMVYLHTLTLGQAFQFLSYTSMFEVGVQFFFSSFVSLSELTPSLDRCDELLHEEEIETAPNAKQLEEVETIEFVNVTAAYPGSNEPVIHDVTFTIRRGEQIALVGESGSGKSTLIYLLARLIEPLSGEIRINGLSIKAYTLESLWQKIAFCLQEARMLHRSLAENLRIANFEATDEELLQALARAGFNVTYNSILDKPVKGSGGQKQRYSIARVLLRKSADTFVFDEFTSALDPIIESQMRKNLNTQLEGKTQLIIAHRYSTIRDADRVIVMADGKVVQIGTLQELLMRRKGLFYKLWTEQMGRLSAIQIILTSRFQKLLMNQSNR